MDLRKLAKEADKVDKEAPSTPKKLVSRELHFSLSYEAGGVSREAVLTSRIMTGDEKSKAFTIASDLARRPWDRLPANAQLLYISLGTVSIQLRNPPEWVLDACQEDEELALQLYASCIGHDARWFSGNDGSGESGEESPRIRITEIGIPTIGNVGGTS